MGQRSQRGQRSQDETQTNRAGTPRDAGIPNDAGAPGDAGVPDAAGVPDDNSARDQSPVRRLWNRARAHPSDAVLVALSVLLLITLGLASLYGMKYGKIDDTVMPGKVTLECNGAPFLTLDIKATDDVTVDYGGLVMHGKLRLEGADTKSVLYALSEKELDNGFDPDGVALLLRVPRSGLQGDLSGPWMVYYAYTKTDAKRSNWALLDANGTAHYGASTSLNPMTTQYPELEEKSSEATWTRDGDRILIDVPEESKK